MVISQYPHIAIIKGVSADATYDNGVWNIPEPGFETQQACRYEPSTLNRELTLTDGVSVKYKGIVYLPLSSPNIDEGISFEIIGVVTAKTLYFIRNEMNCMLYV
jgi:hypothetical protein